MSDRRLFLSRLFAGTIASIALTIVYGVARFLRPPRTSPASLELADTALPPASFTPQFHKLGTNDIAIIRMRDGEVVALRLACTHTGCTVEWRASQTQFRCPCHDGVFASDGSVVSGPPRRPLERIRIDRRGASMVVIDETV